MVHVCVVPCGRVVVRTRDKMGSSDTPFDQVEKPLYVDEAVAPVHCISAMLQAGRVLRIAEAGKASKFRAARKRLCSLGRAWLEYLVKVRRLELLVSAMERKSYSDTAADKQAS